MRNKVAITYSLAFVTYTCMFKVPIVQSQAIYIRLAFQTHVNQMSVAPIIRKPVFS